MISKFDKKNKFISMFEPSTGLYIRSGIIDEDGKDTGVDPFMSSYPELLDIGIMETCACAKHCKVDCYQKAINRTGNNMSISDFESILKQSKGKMFQCALGGAGDVDTHEKFEEILALSNDYKIVPNFTTSGICMTKSKAKLCKKYCGAVAVSEHFANYTIDALNMLLDEGVKTNLHYVLGNKTIEYATKKLKSDNFYKGLNAVVFLLYKPVGLGKEENVLKPNDKRVNEFFEAVDNYNGKLKIGFDSCSCSGIINNTRNIDINTIDYCEGGRFSAYIDANMNMMPCSFGNQDSRWHVSLRDHTIEEAWNSNIFEQFRYSLRNSCVHCKDRDLCGGGCPIVNQVTLCNRKDRNFISVF